MVTAEQALGGAGDGRCCTRSRGGEWRAVHVSLTQESQLRTLAFCFFTGKLISAPSAQRVQPGPRPEA